MMDLAAHIGQLVRKHELVIIPGLGGFLTRFHTAKINALTKKMEAPGKHIAFNSQLRDNDGFLAHSFSQKTRLSYKDALQLVLTFSEFCKEEMQNGGKVSFENLGVLSMDTAGHIIFSADLSTNYDDMYFGLPEIMAMPVLRNRHYQPIVQLHPQAKESIKRNFAIYRKVAAVAIPLITLGVLAWFTKDSIRNFYQQSAGILTIDSSSQADNKTDAKTKTLEASDLEETVAPVTEMVLEETSKPETKEIIITEETSFVDGHFHLITGAFANEDLALKLIEELKSDGFNAYVAGQSKGGLFRVSAGNFENKQKAVDQLQWFKAHVNKEAWLLSEEL